MSLRLLPAKSALALGLTQPFGGLDGVAPYAYTLLEGVGSIDPVTGLYSAGAVLGGATVQVTDANGATAEADIMVGTPLELFCDVIQEELDLQPGRVYLWDQEIKAPSDQGLFVAVGVLSCKPFSNIRRMDADGNSVQSTHFSATLDVSIISKGPEARDRKEELILALNSQYSEAQQELNSFRIFPLSTSFVNLSQAEGAAIPYRFNISVTVQYQVTKTKAAPYYDQFVVPPSGILIDP